MIQKRSVLNEGKEGREKCPCLEKGANRKQYGIELIIWIKLFKLFKLLII